MLDFGVLGVVDNWKNMAVRKALFYLGNGSYDFVAVGAAFYTIYFVSGLC
jgi:hypothetical protein